MLRILQSRAGEWWGAPGPACKGNGVHRRGSLSFTAFCGQAMRLVQTRGAQRHPLSPYEEHGASDGWGIVV